MAAKYLLILMLSVGFLVTVIHAETEGDDEENEEEKRDQPVELEEQEMKWIDSTSVQEAVINSTVTMLFTASAALYNVTIRMGKFSDPTNPGYQYVKSKGTDVFDPIDLSDEQINKFSPNISDNILMYTIKEVMEDDESPYFAEILQSPGKWDVEYAHIYKVIRKEDVVTESSNRATVDPEEQEEPSTPYWFLAVIVGIVVVVLVVVVVIIVCCIRRKKNSSYETYKPVKANNMVKSPSGITNSMKVRTRNNLKACLQTIKVSEKHYMETDRQLMELADKEVKDNYEYKLLGPINNEVENVEIFVNNLQQDVEEILTFSQCKNIQKALSSRTDSLAIEQNSFDDSWRYCTRYCLIAFGTTDNKEVVEGVYVEYDVDIEEDVFDDVSAVERLNWFRYKAMNKLKYENFIADFDLTDSLSEVPQSLIHP